LHLQTVQILAMSLEMIRYQRSPSIMTRTIQRMFLGAWLFLAFAPSTFAVPQAECFPFERLEPRLQARARRLLLAALDREALFTLVGPVKPWSTCGEMLTIPADPPDHAHSEASVADLTSVLSAFRCGEDIEGQVHFYAYPHGGVRFAEPYVMKRSLARKMITEHSDFFRGIGVTHDNPSLPGLLLNVEQAGRYDRFRGYGLFFGYPSSAVDFFVSAAKTEDQTGEFVAREFMSIQTFSSQNGQFVWAVPVGHQETSEETAIRWTAQSILDRYRSLRTEWIENSDEPTDSPKSLELIREWFHDGNGDYSPEHAKF
jgi:hypothetical protein